MKVFRNKDLVDPAGDPSPSTSPQGQDFGGGLTPAKRLKLSKSVENGLVELRGPCHKTGTLLPAPL
jgi:hypothetical protein